MYKYFYDLGSAAIANRASVVVAKHIEEILVSILPVDIIWKIDAQVSHAAHMHVQKDQIDPV